MSLSKIRFLFIVSALMILVLALGFGAALSTGAFKKSLTESYVSSYVLNGGETVRRIEYALKYGKQLDNFFGIQSILREVKDKAAAVRDVTVVLADGRVVYGTVPNSRSRFTGALLVQLKEMMRTGANPTGWKLVDHEYHTLIAIHDQAGTPIGAMDIQFEESVVAPYADAFEQKTLKQTLIVGGIAAAVLLLILLRTQIVDAQTGKLRTRQLLTAVLLVIGGAQIVLTVLAIRESQPVYLTTVARNHQLVGQLVQDNINKVVAKGVPYGGLSGVDSWMNSIPIALPEVESIVLTDETGVPLYSTSRSDGRDNASYLAQLNAANVSKTKLAKDSSGMSAQAVVALSQAYIQSRSRAIIIDAITLLVTTILFSVEIVLFLGIFFHQQALAASAKAHVADATATSADETAIVRPLAFMFFLAASMSASFLPIILKGVDPIFGLPENIFLGLPLTVELLASIASTMATGVILDKKGWRPPFMVGLLVISLGTLLSAISSTTAMLLLSRLVVGVGYGFSWMALRGFVAYAKTEEGQTMGFASLNSGIYAGINCGVILGALLIDRLAYSGIFWMSLALFVVATGFALAFTSNRAPPDHLKDALPTAGTESTLFGDSRVLIFFAAVAIPTAICLMFLNYYVPVYARTIGLSAGDVGRLFLLYGLCVVYLGPVLSRTVIQKYSFKLSTGASFALVIVGLLAFGFFPSLLTCTFAVLMLGLSDGMGLVAQNNYFLSLPSVKQFGVGKSMGIFSIVRKVGQTLGPLVLAWLTLVTLGIGWMAVVMALALLTFMVTSRAAKGAVQA